MAERFNRFTFTDHLRCLDCNTRFEAKTFDWKDVRYARCPICHRMDLNGWTGNGTYDFRSGSQRGIGIDAVVRDRWNASAKDFVVVGKPNGAL